MVTVAKRFGKLLELLPQTWRQSNAGGRQSPQPVFLERIVSVWESGISRLRFGGLNFGKAD
jgi:hypothetical protein